MRKHSILALKVPVLIAVLLTLGGCYTMLRHPRGEIATGERAEFRGSDCASCHAGDFAEPLVIDPYGYAAPTFAGYYDCPWWLPDCGVISGPAFPIYGSGGTKGDGDDTRTDSRGRHIGGRGVSGTPAGSLPKYLPPTTQAGTPAAKGESETRSGEDPPQGQGQQPGRSMKDASPPPQNPPPPDPRKDAPEKDKAKDDGKGDER